MEKYLRSLPEIRRIQDYLIERAEKAGVPVIDNARIESAVNEVRTVDGESLDERVLELAEALEGARA